MTFNYVNKETFVEARQEETFISVIYLSSFKESRGTPWNKPFLAISSAQSSNSAFLEKKKSV